MMRCARDHVVHLWCKCRRPHNASPDTCDTSASYPGSTLHFLQCHRSWSSPHWLYHHDCHRQGMHQPTYNHLQRRAPGTFGTSASLIGQMMLDSSLITDTFRCPLAYVGRQQDNNLPPGPVQTTCPGNSDTTASHPVYKQVVVGPQNSDYERYCPECHR